MRRTLKIIAITACVFLTIAIIGSIAGHVVLATWLSHKLGRDVSASFVYCNPLTGGVYVHGLRCTETDGATTFVEARSVFVRINTYALAARRVSIHRITLDQPALSVVNQDTCFNFSDIPGRFQTSRKPKAEGKKPWAVSLSRIKLHEASVRYAEPSNAVNWRFDGITLAVPGLDFNKGDKNTGVAIELPDGGTLAMAANYQAQTKNLTLIAKADNLSPESLMPVIKQHLLVDDLKGNVSTRLTATGALDDLLAAHITGTLDITDFDMRDGWRHSVAQCKKMSIAINDISLKTMQIDVDKFVVDSLVLDLKTTGEGSTWSRLLPQKTKENPVLPSDSEYSDNSDNSKTSAEAITYNGQRLSADNLRVRVGTLNVAHSTVAYEDKTLPTDFKYSITGLTAKGTEIDTRSTTNHIILTGTLPEGGSLMLNWRGSLDPAKSACRAVAMLRNVKLKALSPWTEHLFGYALQGGSLSVTSDNTIVHGQLDATEHLDVMKPELGKKIKRGTPVVDVPLKLAIGLLKNPQGNIGIQVPVSGDLNSPSFKLSDVIGKAVGNFLLQATASPFVAMAKARNRNDDLSFIAIDMLMPDFTLDQYQKLDLIAEMMKENDAITLTLTQHYNTNSAVQERAVFNLKRDYFREQNQDAIGELTIIDLQKIAAIRDSNADFQSWCKKNVSGKRGSLREKAMAHYGTEALSQEVSQSAALRNAFVLKYLTEQHGIGGGRVIVNTAPAEELHRHKGSPQYTVTAGYEE